MLSMIKVAINAYGTIGRRVADAIKLQKDMELLGIVKRTPDYMAQVAMQRGINIYASDQQTKVKLQQAGLKVEGTLDELLQLAG